MRQARARSRREPTIALINIVFLMLVFFMVAGTLATPVDGELTLVETAALDPMAPPDALVIFPDGRLSYQGQEIADIAAYLALRQASGADSGGPGETVTRLIPDRALPATELVAIARDLRAAGSERVLIVTERGLQ